MYNEASVRDLINKIRQTDVSEAKYWLEQLKQSLSYAQNYFECALTQERLQFVIDDLSTLIAKTAVEASRTDRSRFFAILWHGHIFLEEIRQKALALGVNVDLSD